jgi:hypothetical protein
VTGAAGVTVTVGGVDDDHLAGQAGPGPGHVCVLTQRPRVASTHGPGQRLQGAQRGRSAHPVRLQTEAALQLSQAGLGLDPEDAVDRAGQHAQDRQPLLQRGHVVPADQVPGGEHQDPVTESPAGGIQHPGGLLAHHPVGHQAPALLEGPDLRLE